MPRVARSFVTVNSGIPIGRQYVLSLGCPNRADIASTLSTFLSDVGARITEADFSSDPETGWFPTHQIIHAGVLDLIVEGLREKLAELAGDRGPKARQKVTDNAVPKRVVIPVTEEGHCLQGLLGRVAQSDYPMEIAAVTGNHRDLRPPVAAYDIPFHHVPLPKDTVDKRKAFDGVDEIVGTESPDAIVLARFMQTLPPDLCEKWGGRAINVHHSFLPSFMDARPYLQAYRRGMKLIGTTCHRIIEDPDGGPIIEQGIVCVSHKYTVAGMQRRGRNAEKQILARDLRWHLRDRVQVYGNCITVSQQITVVFQQVSGELDLSSKTGRAYVTKKVSPVGSGGECITIFDQEK